MYSGIIQRRLHDRLPEDSGEWRIVPRRFRHLPPTPEPSANRRLFRLSAANAALQVLLLALATWAAFEFLRERDLPCLMVVAIVVGLATSMAFGARIGRRYGLGAKDTASVLLTAQTWWLVLILIPCYGWGALIALGIPCVFGTIFGAGLGAALGRRENT